MANDLIPGPVRLPSQKKVELTATAFNVLAPLDETELAEAWRFLQYAEGSVMWWIGDLAQYEERTSKGYLAGGWYDEKAKQYGFSKQTLQQATSVAGRLESWIRIQDLEWSKHKVVADAFVQSPEQAEWLGKCKENNWTLRQLKDAIKSSKPLSLPEGKYRIIYADPPWEYATPQHSVEEQETVLETHYPTMSTDRLCALPVGDLAHTDSVLFLWNTVPLLHDGLRLIDAWGFTYKSEMIWDKMKHNVGYWLSVRHERLWVCSRGTCLPDNKKLDDSVQSIERTEHSAKPARFREIIDDLYPPTDHRDRIELFARGSLPVHWDGWGNEAN